MLRYVTVEYGEQCVVIFGEEHADAAVVCRQLGYSSSGKKI